MHPAVKIIRRTAAVTVSRSLLLQRQMESDYPGLTRPVLFDYRKYNQDLTTGSILIEMGGHANSIEKL